MQGCDKTNACYLPTLFCRNTLELSGKIKQYPHGDGTDEQPVPNQPAFIQSDESAQNSGESGKKNSEVQFEESGFHISESNASLGKRCFYAAADFVT